MLALLRYNCHIYFFALHLRYLLVSFMKLTAISYFKIFIATIHECRQDVPLIWCLSSNYRKKGTESRVASNLSCMFTSDDCLSLAFLDREGLLNRGQPPFSIPHHAPPQKNTETYSSVDNSEC